MGRQLNKYLVNVLYSKHQGQMLKYIAAFNMLIIVGKKTQKNKYKTIYKMLKSNF